MKAQSKTIFVLTALLVTAMDPLVNSPALAAPKAACPACASADRQAKALHALNYRLEADRSRGGLLALDALKLFEDFAKLGKNDAHRAETFSSLLPLAREASPYDGESQLASVLASLLKKDAKLKTAYEAYLKSFPVKSSEKASANQIESCKTEQLNATVGEALCREMAGVTGQDSADKKEEAKAKSCERPFVFDDCVK